MVYAALSPRNAPSAPATMTSTRGYGAGFSVLAAATPPMMTVVSLGTIGTTESRKAMMKMTPRNHQFDAQSPRVSVRSVIQLKIPASMRTAG
jgi:hypothetical protein